MNIEIKFKIGDQVMFRQENKIGYSFGKVCGIRIDIAKQSKEIGIDYLVEWQNTDHFDEKDLEVPPSIEEISKAVIDADRELDAKAIFEHGLLPDFSKQKK